MKTLVHRRLDDDDQGFLFVSKLLEFYFVIIMTLSASGAVAAPDLSTAVDSFLSELTVSERQSEIDRILSRVKLNALAIFDLTELPSVADVNKKYRTLSLAVHPDKVSNDLRERAERAFALVNAAKTKLTDEQSRSQIQRLIHEARQEVAAFKKDRRRQRIQQVKNNLASISASRPLRSDSGDDGAAEFERELRHLESSDVEADTDFAGLVEVEMNERLIAGEWSRLQALKQTSAMDGEADRRRDEARADREEEHKAAERAQATQEDRIKSWRNFTQTKGKSFGIRRPPNNNHIEQETTNKRAKRD